MFKLVARLMFLVVGFGLWAAASCGGGQAVAPCPTSSPVGETGEGGPAEKTGSREVMTGEYDARMALAVFDEIVSATRKYHVFTEQTEENLGMKWEDLLPGLREEFSRAKSQGDLLVALYHFVNSLHNPHCNYNPPEMWSCLSAGFDVDVEWVDGAPRFYVAAVSAPDLAETMHRGDFVVGYRGVAASDFLTAFHLESNGNHWRSVASDIASFLSRQAPELHGTRPDSEEEWVLRRRDTGAQVTVRARWRPCEGRGGDSEFNIEYDPQSCAGLPDRAYGDYRLAHHGSNYCVYVAAKGQHRFYPIVRQFSFHYTDGRSLSALRADHENLKQSLARLKGVKGVILDLRDNHGGNNPNWFLDWWAPAPYYDHFVYTRLHEDFDTPARIRAARVTGWGQAEIDAYLEALRNKDAETAFMGPRPFFCPASGCRDWDNHYRPQNQVTTRPVALLVGAGCVSSCDHVVSVFKENQFGPVIGTAGAAGYTAYRIWHLVTHPETGENLGIALLAFSYEVSGKTREPVEAVVVPPDVTVEPTFDNASRYDAMLVEAAISALVKKARSTPAR